MSISERKLHIEPAPESSQFRHKVAFATIDRQHVDQHFGSAKCMLIYGVNESSWMLLEAVEYADHPGSTHDKLPTRISDLKACSAVFCNACGASAIRQLIEQGIHPVKVREGSLIHQLLADIVNELKGEAVGWLARANKLTRKSVQQSDDAQGRLAQLMDEDW
jgi:nitrogen fixation protein NifX